MKKEMTCLKRTNDLFTIGKRLIERLEMTCLPVPNPYSTNGKRIFKIGVNFDSNQQTISDWIIKEE